MIFHFLKKYWFIIAITCLAAIFRLWQLGQVPAPINQDEAGAAYEAWSILHTGKDKWGYNLPVYFIAWGSGQNVLFSYLTIPFLAIFGLSTWVFRLPMALVGIASIPLLFGTLSKLRGRTSANIGSAILAFSPWHIMMSRWGLESNLLPFFTLLSTYFLVSGLKIERQSWNKTIYLIMAFVSLAMACYAYATFWFVLPVYLIFLAITYRSLIKQNPGIWLAALFAMMISILPLIWFAIKNNILKTSFNWESILPFSAPLLAGDRVSISLASIPDLLIKNLGLLALNGKDGMPWNTFANFTPILPFLLPVFLFCLIRYTLTGNFQNPFLLQILAALPLFLLVDLNQNRANVLWIPVIALLSGLMADWYIWLSTEDSFSLIQKRIIIYACLALFVISGLNFAGSYFLNYRDYSSHSFHDGFLDAIREADRTFGNQYVLVPPVGINYVSVAYALQYPPGQFQSRIISSRENGIFRVKSLDKWIFDQKYLKEETSIESFGFISRENDFPCDEPKGIKNLEKNWQLGYCDKKEFSYESK